MKKLIRAAQNCTGKCSINYMFSQIKYQVVTGHPKDFDTPHVIEALKHTFNGQDHRECGAWCKARDAEGKWTGHKTTLPYGKYMDRRNNIGHKYAYAVFVSTWKKRFDSENCVRLRNTPRTNPNENMNSLASGMINKHTRPSKGHIVSGICHASAYIKNEGRGRLYRDFLFKLGLHVGKSQMEKFQVG